MSIEEDKRYSTFQNVKYLFGEIALYDKKLYVYIILSAVSGMLLPLITLGLTAVAIEAVTHPQNAQQFIPLFMLLLLGVFIFTVIPKIFMGKAGSKANAFRVSKLMKLSGHLTTIDYDLFDGDKGQEKINKAFETARNPQQAFQNVFTVSESFIKNVLGFILYSYVLATVHWLFIVLIAASSLINFFYSLYVNKKEDQNKKRVAPINRKINYLTEKTGNFQTAKDMRLYKMESWFGTIFSSLSQEKYDLNEKVQRRKFLGNVLDSLFTLVIDFFAYIFLINLILNGEMNVASFTVYFGAIATLSKWISGLLKNATDFNKIGLEIDNYRAFMEIESKMNHGKGIDVKNVTSMPYSIEFKHVSYRYPEADKDTIKDLNFLIKHGEKIALVGINGAGKSTIVKLLTGLYRPTEGEIRINNRKVDDFNIDDYYDLFSVVFQDYYELPITIDEMVLQGRPENFERLKAVEKQSGLDQINQRLPKHGQTKMVKRVHNDAIDLSGGQKQKLQLARALYKDGPILVLDEPTAALDPIAESEIYQQYETLSKDKTSIFVSHRLSSTRFCDRIFFIEDGEILEEGTHSELMRLQGKYYEMLETQSYYYKNKVGEK